MNLEPVDMRAILISVVESLSDYLRAGQVQALWQAGTEPVGGRGMPPALISADVRRFRQALRSLLRFALNRACPIQGGVGIIELGLAEQHEIGMDHAMWRLTIRDSGAVLDQRTMESLFTLFSHEPVLRGVSGVAGQKEGLVGGTPSDLNNDTECTTTEIGLALARAVIEAHAGTIKAEEAGASVTLPGGMALIVDLPVAATPEREGNKNQAIPGMLRILLVEDHQDTQLVLANLLRRSGYHVMIAGSVREAKEIIARGPVDLLISDIGLPDGTGMEIMAGLKESGAVPGIALSGYGTPEDIQKSKEAGFAVHLVKPVNVRVLEQAVLDVVVGPMGS